ncbi:S-layer domain-containing protein [Crinalium epipsammum PCC 9333]|uniref:S-layer domain-containing protein n=1 Tax=Crinalium epipsammum PCC 9333 TaxID=1173022 RepID=K9W6E8_9CYAN|nr:S-layer homology domain-containing protein [Crinalium epipsammum]AFZ15384.1 S-layer domain-containing protein [Crinalium epipsammum PCC 9333]
MSIFSGFTSKTAALVALGITANAVVPLAISAPATAADFSDVNNHWARPFIEALADQKIISGYSDGTFKPDQAVTRAEFAALVQAAFPNNRETRPQGYTFRDVSTNHWAYNKIQKAYKTGFMSGVTTTNFAPDTKIPRVQALVTLTSGLNIDPQGSTSTILRAYQDATEIPQYARNKVAAATEKRMVVNYPVVDRLRPNQITTRGEVAAFLYQAMVNQGQAQTLDTTAVNRYIVGATTDGTTQNANLRVRSGQTIVVRGADARPRILLLPNESIPNLTLIVDQDIRNSANEILIPRNSQIEGRLSPLSSGNQFLGMRFDARRLIIGNQSYDQIDATSRIVTGQQQQASSVNTGTVENAAITAAAQAILGRVLGQSVNPINILGSIFTGQTPTTQQQDQVIIIDPRQDLQLTFNSDFYVNRVATGSN